MYKDPFLDFTPNLQYQDLVQDFDIELRFITNNCNEVKEK